MSTDEIVAVREHKAKRVFHRTGEDGDPECISYPGVEFETMTLAATRERYDGIEECQHCQTKPGELRGDSLAAKLAGGEVSPTVVTDHA